MCIILKCVLLLQRGLTVIAVVCCVASIGVCRPGGGYGYGGGNDGDSEGSASAPSPYSFSYSAEDEQGGGSHSHTQSFDGKRVQGHYMIQMADGSMRRVEYHADEKGFHAKIVTNELGTESKNPADAIFESSAPTGAEAALKHSSNTSYKTKSNARSSAYSNDVQDWN